jgi:Flp pilus assembly protein TadG
VAGIEFIAIAGVLAMLVFGAVQIGLVYYAKAVVTSAANAGAEVASAGSGSDAAGQAKAQIALTALGPLAASSAVEVTDGPGTVTVKTSVRVASIVPFLSGVPVDASFTMHKELPGG